MFGACFFEICEVGPDEWLDPLLSPLRVKRGRGFREGVVFGLVSKPKMFEPSFVLV